MNLDPTVFHNASTPAMPNGWQACRLREVVASDKPIVYGIVQAGPHIADGVPYITSADVNGTLSPDSLQRTSREIAAKYKRSVVVPGDIVFSLRGNIGESCIVPDYLPLANLTQGTARISTGPGFLNQYIRLALSEQSAKRQINAVAKGSTFREISLGALREVLISVPPWSEQRRIAEILLAWESAITSVETLITANQRRKVALMQQLLTGKVRLPRFTGEWESKKAGDLFKAVSTKNHPGERVLSVTQDAGVVNRDDMDRKIGMSLDNTGGYKLVRPGDYIISLRSFQGGLEMSRLRGIVSPAYHVIHPVIDIDREFFRHYFKSYEFIGRLGVAVIGIRDGKQISFEDFGYMTFRVPPVAEQSAIAVVLNAADEEIALLTRKLDALRRQKKGLMQQLLTGKVRVAVTESSGK